MAMTLVVGLLLSSTPTWSQDFQKPPLAVERIKDLEQLNRACKRTLKSCDEVVKEKDELGKQKDEAIKFLREENKDLRKKKDNILTNPYLWGAFGVILGVVISK